MDGLPFVPFVLAGALSVFGVRPVLAGNAPCPHLAVDEDATARSRWPELPARVQAEFDGRDDIDTCARVKLVATDTSMLVEVVLRDGRSASRAISAREDLVPTLEALLLVPRHDDPPTAAPDEQDTRRAPAPAEPPASPVVTSGAAVRLPDPPSSGATNVPKTSGMVDVERDAPKAFRGDPAEHLRIELSALTGARVGDGQRSLGVGVLSFLDVGGWLVGFEGRADRYETLSGIFSGPALELAALGGRRFRLQALALDLTMGFAAAVQGTVRYETPDSSASSSSVVPRFVLGSRLDFGARSVLRGFVGVDGEWGPPRASTDGNVPDPPHLPRWTLGLALGATVGTL